MNALALLVLTGCGGESVPDVPDASDTAEDRNGTSRVASNGNLKRFGVMPSFGDLDTMVERRIVRVLTVYGPGRYFLEDGPQGTVQEYADKLQEVINETFKTGLLTVQVAVIPVSRDQLFPALENGYGDIVMAGTTITDTRQESADFTDPVSKPLREILITGPSAPAIGGLEDLSGSTVHTRLCSSYADSVLQLNG